MDKDKEITLTLTVQDIGDLAGALDEFVKQKGIVVAKRALELINKLEEAVRG